MRICRFVHAKIEVLHHVADGSGKDACFCLTRSGEKATIARGSGRCEITDHIDTVMFNFRIMRNRHRGRIGTNALEHLRFSVGVLDILG
jgi:hypothetical protein